jgi:LPS export ABC transporter protein LptC
MNHKEIERWYRLKKIQKASQIIVILAIFLLAGGYATSKWFQEPGEKFISTKPDDSDMRIENFSYSSPGVHAWELKAKSAAVSQAMDNVDLIKPQVKYRGGQGGEILLTADKGNLDKNSRKVTAQGNVMVAYNDLSFTTGQIDYLDDKKIAESPSIVCLDGGDLKVTGKGLKVAVDSEEMVIEHDVKASISNVRIFGQKKKYLQGKDERH